MHVLVHVWALERLWRERGLAETAENQGKRAMEARVVMLTLKLCSADGSAFITFWFFLSRGEQTRRAFVVSKPGQQSCGVQ